MKNLEKGRSKKPAANNSTGKQGWLRSLFVMAIVVGVIRTSFAGAFHIPSGSMKNTLLVGDYLFVNEIGYFIQTPRYIPFTSIAIPHLHLKTWNVDRRDVVVFDYPGDRDEVVSHEQKYLIKRCIGLPGDAISIKDKQVFVNNKLFPNPAQSILESDTARAGLVDPGIFPRGAQWNRDNFGPLRVPKQG
ncbi:MAG TPA: signal peptidase I, partial [Candidatus Kapabacteria bacterium]|nr:signal peptidase I [Candidatus Kapabacteria bacterium]